ncbi:MAG: SRPBCC family protein [Dysgonamonadaceae bacterium]|jgi:carbon monoxide dehydrogenase subunit G|nr:SRPBCC family protein [Dysgonamonadaceae bacterium]
MTEFTSEIKKVPYGEKAVFEMLSDMSNLERIKDRIPTHNIQDFTFDTDSCSFSVSPVGRVGFKIVEREPSKTIKFSGDKLPVDMFMWIQLKEVAPDDTRLKLTIRAELNPFLKPMLSKPLQEGINKIADVLATIPYGEV